MPRRILRSEQAEREDNGIKQADVPVQHVRSLLAEAQALSSRLAALHEVAVAIQANLDTEEVLYTFAREARWVIDFQVCSIALREGASVVEQVLRASAGYAAATSTHSIGQGIVSQTITTGEAQLRHSLDLADGAPADIQSALILPLRNGTEIIGTVNFYARLPNAYTIDDLRIGYALALQVAVVIQNARLLKETTQARDELNTVLESISDAVLVVNNHGYALLMNTAMGRLLHLDSSKTQLATLYRLLAKARRNGRRLFEAQLLRALRAQWREQPNGVVCLSDNRYVEWTVVPLVGTGTIAGFVITARDITERIEVEQLRDTLTNMLVHDLRSPLTGVIGGLDLLKLFAGKISQDEFHEVLQQTRMSAERLLDLINSVLDVRKMQAGRLEIEPTPQALRLIVEQALRPMQATLQHSNQRVAIEIPDTLPALSIDATLIRRVLENLLSNALKFSPPGSVVTILAQQVEPALIEVCVRDQGIGIPESQQTHIFEMFGQVRGAQARRGTGLGLTFCKLAVEAHTGTIGVRSVPGQGSTFWLTLPIAGHEPRIE